MARVLMPIKALDHVQLAMPAGGEELARHFYTDLLGIPEIAKPPHLAKRGGCWFERGALKVHLGVDPEFRPALKAHPAFVVTGLASLVARLKDNEVAVGEDEPLPGFNRCYAADPFGNRIELLEKIAGRPQDER